jgi:GNAT superfamily N-acetyltransferase
MAHIIPLTKDNLEPFKKLFTAYYQEMDCDENIEHLISEYILPDWEAELISIALAAEQNAVVGFVIYQIDGIENDWCIHEGWGDVREIFVEKSNRRQHIGSALLAYAEQQLSGLPLFALPSDESESFFLSHGYRDSLELESTTSCKIFLKNI